MVFVPSPAEKTIACVKVPLLHEVVDGEFTPAPDIFTVKLDSQVPAIIRPVCACVFALGDVKAIKGAVVSLMKSRLTEVVLSAASVCVTTMFFVPSEALNVRLCEYVELEQLPV